MTEAVAVNPIELSRIRRALLRWYDENRRNLPWRETKDPYRIWISEIMLQQTRVAAVLEHYREFLLRFPSVETLAAARLEDVLAVWSGLGYYRRARALHEAAKTVVSDHNGQLPSTVQGLRGLSGIGRYTSAAIASIAFGVPQAVVDGNVERVLRRLSGVDLKGEQNWTAAQQLLDSRRPGDWNQAVMELGATLCTPVSPECQQCPMRKWCKEPGASIFKKDPPRRKVKVAYGLAIRDGRIYLERRAATESLMPGLWELPQVEAASGDLVTTVKHSITVSDIVVRVVRWTPKGKGKGRWIKLHNVSGLPLTGLTRKILRTIGELPSATPTANKGRKHART